MHHVYIDESGDLGFTFANPFRFGGSSRYLTIACYLCPESHSKYSKRRAKSFKKAIGLSPQDELKGSNLTAPQLNDFSQRVVDLVTQHSGCEVRAITVKKKNVEANIRTDANKLYNYMIRLCLLDHIKELDEVRLIPDPRTIKVKSGNSMVDYLQSILMFDMNSATRLIHNPYGEPFEFKSPIC